MSKNNFFVMIKPDGVRRGLIGEIIKRFEKRGFAIKNMIMATPEKDHFEEHYKEHKTKGFYDDLIKFSMSGNVLLMKIYGNIQIARRVIGPTTPWKAKKGSIRGDFACSIIENLIHFSDSLESAKREICLWFGK